MLSSQQASPKGPSNGATNEDLGTVGEAYVRPEVSDSFCSVLFWHNLLSRCRVGAGLFLSVRRKVGNYVTTRSFHMECRTRLAAGIERPKSRFSGTSPKAKDLAQALSNHLPSPQRSRPMDRTISLQTGCERLSFSTLHAFLD